MIDFEMKGHRADIELWMKMSRELDSIWGVGCLAWIAEHKPTRIKIINDLEEKFKSICDNETVEPDGSPKDQELHRIITSLRSAYITALNIYKKERK